MVSLPENVMLIPTAVVLRTTSIYVLRECRNKRHIGY